jgi:hypothetical protein
MRLALPLLLLMAGSAIGTETSAPARLTTDSAEYCEELSARVDRLPQGETGPPRTLVEEGRRLCADGHVRTGIAKLRRAIRAAQSETRRG